MYLQQKKGKLGLAERVACPGMTCGVQDGMLFLGSGESGAEKQLCC